MTIQQMDVDLADSVAADPSSAPTAPTPGEIASDISARLDADGLSFPTRVVEMAAVSLLLGKHLLFVGPPGTGKTTLAEKVAATAAQFGMCAGYTFATGSSDWTPAETVGAYGVDAEKAGQLKFEPGQVLTAIEANQWLILDELNRADIDRALGPLFTVLSGQATTLPYRTLDAGTWKPISVVPEDAPTPVGHYVVTVPRQWRMVATMNLIDRDVLFDVSNALLRRFAYIEVGLPERAKYEELLATHGTGEADLDAAVVKLGRLKGLSLGPAITLDVARYVKERLAGSPSMPRGELIREAVEMFVQPQLSGLRPHQVSEARAELGSLFRVEEGAANLDSAEADFEAGELDAGERGLLELGPGTGSPAGD